LGTGQENRLSAEDWRQAAGEMVAYLKRFQANKIGLDLRYWLRGSANTQLLGQSIAEGFELASYEFSKYKKSDKNAEKIDIKEIHIYSTPNQKNSWLKGWETGQTMARGVKIARDLVNEPAGSMTPEFLAEEAKIIAKGSSNIKVKILDREQAEKLGMGAYLAIARGSHEAPKFIHLVYKPNGRVKDKVALVGKGVTFDSGGLNIKPWENMQQMKIDMGGAATVLGVFAILDALKPKVEVHGIIAACENMPSGNAVKPGDVVRNMQGKSIEISNTDAEGRVTLADSLAYAQKQGVKKIVDIATLTGAVIMALGPEYAGIFSNNQKLVNDILKSATNVNENIWQLPLAPEYKDLNKSQVADLKNVSSMRMAGSITAAWFLANFIKDDVSWAHIDIAGPVYAEKSFNSYTPIGGVGFGVRTLIDWIENL
jgi:leucyl aminopeptidase